LGEVDGSTRNLAIPAVTDVYAQLEHDRKSRKHFFVSCKRSILVYAWQTFSYGRETMKTIRLSVFAIFVSLAFTGALVAKEKDEDESESAVQVEKLILVRDAGEKFVPVKKFKPTDTLGVLVQLSEAKEGTKIKGVWTVVDAGGMQDKKIFEKKVEFTPEAIKTAKEPSRVDFTLAHDNPYPTGDYKFEVYLNGELADTVEFKVEE
jgi:hypothetical protein